MTVETRTGGAVERRDPKAATQQVRWVGSGIAQVPTWDARRAIDQGWRASWVVARCVQIIANDIATAPFLAGRIPGDRSTTNPGARLAQLLGPPPHGPAPKVTARRLWWFTVASRIVTGRWAWEVETGVGVRADGPIDYLWPLAAPEVHPIPSDGGASWWQAFKVGRPDRPRTLPVDAVIYDWCPSLDDFRDPFSPLQAARLDTSISVMLGRYAYSFLQNGATPATVVVVEEFPDEEGRRRFEQQWQGRYGGVDNAGRVHIHEVGEGEGSVGDAIHIETVGLSQKDARMIEAEKEALEHVAMALGVPWSRLSASGRTFDNASQEDRTYWHDTVLPIATDLQDAINLQVAPRCGTEVGWFDFSHVEALRPTPMFTLTDAVAGYQGQLLTLDEARSPFGLPPVDDGDEFYEPPAVEAAEPPAEDAAEGETGPGGSDGEDSAATDRQGDADTRRRVSTAGDGGRRPASPAPARRRTFTRPGETADARRARLWRSTDAAVTTLETRWAKAWRRMFTRQADSVARALTGKRGAKLAGRVAEWRADPAPQIDPAAVFNPSYWRAETETLAADLYEAVAAAGFARMSDAFGIALDIDTTRVQAFIQARANQLAGQVTDTTYQAIRDVLAEGVQTGQTIDEIADGIRHVFDIASETRAVTIARTEVISAYNGASQLGATELGGDVVAGKEWIATRDGRTRPGHADADGQTVAIGQPFDVDGEALVYPGDPGGSPENTVQCRCTVGFLTPDEMADRAAAAEHTRVPIEVARALVTVTAGGSTFDELGVRRALQEAAA